jgi:filamentous hemagglutinin family protein
MAMHPRLSKLLLTTTALSAFLGLVVLGAPPATSGPEGGTVVGGAATISGQGGAAVVVNQSSSHAIINWHTFNIGTGQSVTFNQPGSSSVALNRVTGGLGPSEILGTLTANGRVFVINRDGVLFGPGAVINTAGFLATTSDIKNSDFMAGRYIFNIPGRPDASIVNLGKITATSGGFAALVAPGVRNSGTITATLGTVTLGAANSFTLDLYGDRLITLAVNDQIASKVIDVATGLPLKSLITNDGKIRANGGRVELTAAAARHVVDSVINTSGVIKANSIGKHNGMIVLSAATGSSKGAGAPTQTIKVSGTLSAAGKKNGTTGGTILVTGEDIQFVNAVVDASGSAGGGKVLIGGDWAGGNPTSGLVNNQSAKLENFLIPTATTVSVDAGTTINASAKDSGNGGKVILWSDQLTTFAGTILARGGVQSGNGGFVETSGHQSLTVAGTVDLSAPQGRHGTWLLDPVNVTIDNVAAPGVVTVASIQSGLLTGDVVVTTGGAGSPGSNAGDITVASGVNLSWATNSTLTLSAYHNISFAFGAVISNTGAGNLVLRANNSGNPGTTAGDVAMFSGSVDFSGSTGTVSVYHNPIAGYAFPNYPYDYATLITTNPMVSNQVKTYALVNDATELAAIGASEATRSGQYALGRNFSAGDFEGFNPGSDTFTSGFVFDGNGGLGVNHTINGLTLASASSSPVGLFPVLGAGATVRNLNLTDVTIIGMAPNTVGTVAGISSGAITNVHVSNGIVHAGGQSDVIVGGLVGQLASGGTIAQSSTSTLNVIGSGTYNQIGGLVGFVQAGASITDSNSTGGLIKGGTTEGGVPTTFNIFAGGLVGRNGGTITNSFSSNAVSGASQNGSENFSSSIGGLVGFNDGVISGSNATGPVSGESLGAQYAVIVGGLVGLNNSPGLIENSWSSSTVTGIGQVELGGLVGGNFASISNSYATGSVTGTGDGSIGGLVGLNSDGAITNSHATGAVAGNVGNVTVGGLVGDSTGESSIINSFATGAVNISAMPMTAPDQTAGGLVGTNEGTITGSYATGSVTSTGGDVFIGGLVGGNTGSISNSYATGNVTAVNASFASAGGFAGYNGGSVFQSYATGNVTVSGETGIAGGFVGINTGYLNQVFSTGAVTGNATSNFLGSFVGVNADFNPEPIPANGLIVQAYATGAVTGNGANNVIGGFAAVNTGRLEETYAIGKLTGAGLKGGLVAANTGTPLGSILEDYNISLFGTGVAVNSYWDAQTTGVSVSAGGTTRSTQDFVGTLPGGFDPGVWGIVPNPSYPHFAWQPPITIPITDVVTDPLPPIVPSPQVQIVDNLVTTFQFANLNTSPPLNTQGGVRQPSFPPPPPQGFQGPPSFPRLFDIPPLSETRFITDEVVLQVRSNIAIADLENALRRFGLTLLASDRLGGTTDTIVLRFRITNGQSVRDIIRQLASVQIVALAQPNYFFLADQKSEPAPASRGDAGQQQGDAAQYILQKLRISDVHRIVRGTNVPIAVIDSEIDAAHPDLQGVIAERFSAVGAPEKPHAHGTGMAGAIASRQRLMGIAPSSRILAVHAFSTKAATAESTTFSILKGIDWSVSQGARVINMSFAGPKDPSLERALKTAYDKGVVLIAAAGNAGPKSPPLFPGADPNVIAVTATDADDKIFVGANRGKYVAVSAPGVDILVPAPDGSYQLTTGTSVAAAEVSGVVALLLERNPRLTPADIKRILTGSAKRLAPGDRDDNFGSGLVDPLRAVQSNDPRTVAPAPTLRQR